MDKSVALLSLLLGGGLLLGLGNVIAQEAATFPTQEGPGNTSDGDEDNASIADAKDCACATARVITDFYCPMEYQWVLGGCFLVNSYTGSGGRTDWTNTRLACQALHGELAHITDPLRFAAYIAIFHDDGTGNPDVWVGAQRDGEVFKWINGTIIPNDSSLWSRGHPRELSSELKRDCVFLDGNGLLRTAGCQYDKHSVCEYKP